MVIVVGCSSDPQEDPLAFCQKFLDIASPDAPLNSFDFDEERSTNLDQHKSWTEIGDQEQGYISSRVSSAA